ncbi:hypothetical protein NXC24_PA00210 (plasmid) [Rhizobium sp. NXC24]|nr:hypothetical protein NXC24_PA00210 [Rhizobium sp. NXC24]
MRAATRCSSSTRASRLTVSSAVRISQWPLYFWQGFEEIAIAAFDQVLLRSSQSEWRSHAKRHCAG